LEYVPDDKNIQQELLRANQALNKETKKADKKMAGFLASSKKVQSGDGIFSDADRDRDTSGVQLPSEPVKLRDGLFLVPKDETDADAQAAKDEGIDMDEISREINEMREERPEVFAELRNKMQVMVEDSVAQREAELTGGGDSAA